MHFLLKLRVYSIFLARLYYLLCSSLLINCRQISAAAASVLSVTPYLPGKEAASCSGDCVTSEALCTLPIIDIDAKTIRLIYPTVLLLANRLMTRNSKKMLDFSSAPVSRFLTEVTQLFLHADHQPHLCNRLCH